LDIVNLTRYAPLHAIIHKHPVGEDFLFGQEIHYTNDGAMVTQTNVETGESYRHQSMMWLWDNKLKVHREGEGSFTWELQKFTNETWIVTFVKCRGTMDEGVRNRITRGDYESRCRVFAQANRWSESAATSAPTKIELPTGSVIRAGPAGVFVLPGDENKELRLTNPKYVEMLRKSIVGKPRNGGTLRDLYALARREADKEGMYPGSGKYSVKAKDISDHVTFAFLVDVTNENLNMASIALRANDLATQRAATRDATSAMAPGTRTLPLTASKIAAAAMRLAGKNSFALLADTLHE